MEGSQNNSQPPAMRRLNPGYAAGLEKASKTGVPEAHNHISIALGPSLRACTRHSVTYNVSGST
jgi:hypothetical protein